MSLLFEHAIDQFQLEHASLVSAETADLTPTETEIPAQPIGDFASLYTSLEHPDRDWTCIPLHDDDGAAVTDEFVAYTDHTVRGRIFLLAQSGEEEYETIAADEFAQTQLAKRIRFWHSDYLPDSDPPGYDAPIDDREQPRHPVSTDLLAEFRAYVDEERAATRSANRAQASEYSARHRYEQGEAAIPSLASLGQEDGMYKFSVNLPASLQDQRDGDWAYFVENEIGIYQGNEVLLHADGDSSPEAFPVTTTVQRIRGLTIWLTIDWGAIDDAATVGSYLDGAPEVGVSELLNPVPFDRERDAIEALEGDSFESILAGAQQLTFSHDAAAVSEQFDTELNQEQQLAVRYALLADDLFCIHGPPGTGKTRTLLEIIRRAVDAGEDVLVCTDSNQALDNLVVGASTPSNVDPQSLHARSQHGCGEFVLDRVNAKRSNHDIVRDRYTDVADRADVVAATNSSAATLHRSFDLVVLDEATQSTCTASCIPLARADRAVLAGDHHQLPPFSATEKPPASSYGLSLFEHLYADGGVYAGVGLQLKTQYRMHPDIAYFSNREFYNRSLRTGEIIEPLSDRPAIEGYNLGGEVTVKDHSRANETEARLVVHLLQQVLDTVSAEDIGVITPYTAQVRVLRDTLAEHIAEAERITVDTIDSFQGSEKTAVIISLVRSNGDGDIGFLGRPSDGPRRLNVALTRAKRYCAVVGDFHTLRYDTEGKCTEFYRSFEQYFETTGRLRNIDPEFLPV